MEKVDPYHHKRIYDNWCKSKSIKGINKKNSALIIKYLDDMAVGININGSKGARSPIRLNSARSKLGMIISRLEKRGVKDIKKTTAQDLHSLFEDFRSGKILNTFGKPYKSIRDFVKSFKAFWHWHQKVQRKKKIIVEDITLDLDTRGEKPKFVYFTEKDFQKILNKASYDLKPLIALAYDSGLRVTELMNIRISDFSEDYKRLNIRDETSKTFGRKVKLMMCSNQIKDYVKKLDLKEDMILAQKSPTMINKELKQIGENVLLPDQIKFKSLTLYDFRHSSACFWLVRYKSESALKYRFGWKRSDMIHYYTEFLGMEDTITNEDLYLNVTKTELEKKYDDLQKEVAEMKQHLKMFGDLKRGKGSMPISVICKY